MSQLSASFAGPRPAVLRQGWIHWVGLLSTPCFLLPAHHLVCRLFLICPPALPALPCPALPACSKALEPADDPREGDSEDDAWNRARPLAQGAVPRSWPQVGAILVMRSFTICYQLQAGVVTFSVEFALAALCTGCAFCTDSAWRPSHHAC